MLDLAQQQVGALARELMNAIQDELDGSSQYFALREQWRRARGQFIAAFEGHLGAALRAAASGVDPLRREAAGLDSLSLVDESQALQDVAIAHVVHTVEHRSQSELHQVGNFFAALRGTARARERDNPLRPALFAHALHLALAECSLAPQARHDLLRIAAQPLASRLHALYSQICERLRSAQLSDMVAGHGGTRYEAQDLHRLAAARGANVAQGTLEHLARRVDAINSRPQGFATRPGGLPAQPEPFVRATGPDILSRLYDQILADPRLLAPLKGLLARLQIAVVRMSRTDPSLLRRQDHPTWALLNRVAAHGMTFDKADDPALQAFVQFVDGEIKQLVDAPALTGTLFAQALARVQTEIDRQSEAAHSPSVAAIAALERSEQRGHWLTLIREQIEHQIVGAPLAPRVKHFLQTAWVEVIVDTMVRHGTESAETLGAIDTVDALLDSLRPPVDRAAIEGLRMRLPVLIQRLRDGCSELNLPPARTDAFFAELMEQHGRVLRGLPALERQAPRAPAPPPSADAIVQKLMEERDSQQASHWADAEVDRSGLPTVPVSLYSNEDPHAARAALQAWIDGLCVFDWFYLYAQGDWHIAQLAWMSESRQTFLFVGREPHQRHSLTRGALEALIKNGLITALDDENVVQRAVNTLMSDLDDGG
jgi:hypothetical protein